MILSWLALFLFIFGAFGEEHLVIGKHPVSLNYKKARQSFKIINGNKTSVYKYPFVASILHKDNEFGAAAILSKWWLVTTAYATTRVDKADLHFRVGSNSYSEKGQVFNAAKVVLHPNYTSLTWDYDISLVKTDIPIKFNRKVKPIKLASKDLAGGTKAYVAGWGMPSESVPTSDVLREAKVTVLDWDECAQTYKSDLTPRLMCTFDQTVGPCAYDFGDPLVVGRSLHGLYAGGHGCRPGVHPVLYSDIPPLAAWIKSVITTDGGESD